MKTVTDLNQALQQLQLQTKRNMEEMHQYEEIRKHAEGENGALENDIKTAEEEIRIAEQRMLKLKQEILLKKKKIDDNKKTINKSIQEITRMRMDNQRSSSQLQQIEREYREAVTAASKFGSNNGTKH